MNPTTPGRCRQRPRGGPRRGQAMVEIGLALIVFMMVVLLIFDASWLFYHQVVATQAVKRTARRAATNRFDQARITDFFFRSTPASMITSQNSDVTLTVTTAAADVTFASVDSPGGIPSVTVQVSYVHHYIAPIPWGSAKPGTFTITAAARSLVTTWDAATVSVIPSFVDVCPCP